MVDALLQLQASVMKSSTFNSTGVDLKTGTPPRGMVARLLITAASGTTPTLDGKIQESADNSAWNDLVVFPQQTAAAEISRTFSTRKRYVRFVATIGGTTPSFTYEVDVVPAIPG
jgi:hypothetical protein